MKSDLIYLNPSTFYSLFPSVIIFPNIFASSDNTYLFNYNNSELEEYWKHSTAYKDTASD